ncbi:retrovirus-related pol polyprotein from transposon TNT 1-94 [Tanacetum coccineum]|uniref:Retrovirus-related pol polyprotein from transposon TNT 1-94 n=1 Tax=Tanacetum coccineum TaxID=301880 RepID=A0ABQ4XTV2_9ASTR
MDLCGPMRVETINGKRYILIIVDNYSRYTWVYFLHTKDEASEMIIKFINQIQRNMKLQVLKVRFDNGTEFKNEKLRSYYENLGIIHQKLIARTPQQNGVVEHRNQTLVGAARTMLIFSRSPEFLWAEAISKACFTQNRSLVHTRRFDLIPSKEDLDNLFGPLYEEYEEMRTPKVSNNSATNTLNNDDTPSYSSIIVEDHEAPHLVSSSEKTIANELMRNLL